MALHDIVIHPPQIGCEVNRLWIEIIKNYPYVEIIRDPHQEWAGIGIVYIQ